MLKLLENKAINRDAWNKCIAKSKNELPYAYTWFLDIVSPSWEAFVWGDYEYVMPLPIKKKYGIKYLVQPPFSQQLGIFSEKIISFEIINTFIKAIPYKNVLLNLNEQNHFDGVLCPNYLLSLNDDYKILYANFSTNTKRNLKKKLTKEFSIKEDLSLHSFLDLCKKQSYWNSNYQNVVEKIIVSACKNKVGHMLGLVTSSGELLAACFLLKSSHRIIYHIAASTDQGKATFAMYHLVNYIIKKYAGTGLLIDFEGSKVEGVARFYKSFGAKKVNYYRIEKGLLKYIFRLNVFKK